MTIELPLVILYKGKILHLYIFYANVPRVVLAQVFLGLPEWSVRRVLDNEIEPLALHDRLVRVNIKMD